MSKSSSSPRDLPILAITAGDPAGVGPEIIAKALSSRSRHAHCSVVLGDRSVIEQAMRRWSPQTSLAHLSSIEQLDPSSTEIQVWDPPEEENAAERQAPEVRYIREAALGCLKRRFHAMVTAPICKESLYRRGFPFPGHTEYLAHLTGSGKPVMMFSSPSLKVTLATIHIPLIQVPRDLSTDCVTYTLEKTSSGLTDLFCIAQPRLAVCGLNPHAGENGYIGNEEQTVIRPAIENALANGILAEGPFPADTLFPRAAKGEFDAVVALYHDQGLIPLKMAAFGSAVNLTLGLPIIRTSVGHGVAYDIAGKGIADSSSMSSALKLAREIVLRRVSARTQKGCRSGL